MKYLSFKLNSSVLFLKLQIIAEVMTLSLAGLQVCILYERRSRAENFLLTSRNLELIGPINYDFLDAVLVLILKSE